MEGVVTAAPQLGETAMYDSKTLQDEIASYDENACMRAANSIIEE